MKFTRREYLYFIMGIVFLSFGVTIPLGVGIIIVLALTKIKEITKEAKTESSIINVEFVN
ncbi:MAG: hypothetical protein ISR80_05795 [Nitrosopumilus sp.]|nr:hypothetical protein [Nitrosopumilus sp.]